MHSGVCDRWALIIELITPYMDGRPKFQSRSLVDVGEILHTTPNGPSWILTHTVSDHGTDAVWCTTVRLFRI